jgi:hypothetical protein
MIRLPPLRLSASPPLRLSMTPSLVTIKRSNEPVNLDRIHFHDFYDTAAFIQIK